MKNLLQRKSDRSPLSYTDSLHRMGRIFTIVCLILVALVPVVYCLAANVAPEWKVVGSAWSFILGYLAIGLVEAISYAPILGVGGQYLAFITGNISNLKLPCSLNTQTILKTEQGSEEQEIVSTISIAVSSIVTTLIIAIGLIPLAIFGGKIVEVLKPVSPYVIPAIFGGLGVVLIVRYFKLTVIPFAILLLVTLVMFLLGSDPGQATMITVGMVVSIASGATLYFVQKKKESRAAKKIATTHPATENTTPRENESETTQEGKQE